MTLQEIGDALKNGLIPRRNPWRFLWLSIAAISIILAAFGFVPYLAIAAIAVCGLERPLFNSLISLMIDNDYYLSPVLLLWASSFFGAWIGIQVINALGVVGLVGILFQGAVMLAMGMFVFLAIGGTFILAKAIYNEYCNCCNRPRADGPRARQVSEGRNDLRDHLIRLPAEVLSPQRGADSGNSVSRLFARGFDNNTSRGGSGVFAEGCPAHRSEDSRRGEEVELVPLLPSATTTP